MKATACTICGQAARLGLLVCSHDKPDILDPFRCVIFRDEPDMMRERKL